MPTSYTHAFRLAAATHWGEAANHASYQGLAAFTVLELSRYDGAAGNGGTLVFKGNSSDAADLAWGMTAYTDGRVDALRGRATENEWYRWSDDGTVDASNAWAWKALRGSTAAPRSVSVGAAAHQGTVALPTAGLVSLATGSGAVVDNASWPVRVGRPPTGFNAWPREVAFVGLWASELTLAQLQAAVDDFDGNRGTAALPQPVAFWKPGSSDTAQIANGIASRPALVYSAGVTLVTGPDAVPPGPVVSAINPTSGRATGTVVDVTVDNSAGATAVEFNNAPGSAFSIVNPTTVRAATNGATTGPVSVLNGTGEGAGPTFTVVPVADAFRFVGAAPWAPAAGPTLGVPYTLTVEAYNVAANARDTLFAEPVTLTREMVSGDPIRIASGAGPVTFAAGTGTFTNVVFAEDDVPPFDPRIPGGGPHPGARAGLARFLAQNPKMARALRAGKNPRG